MRLNDEPGQDNRSQRNSAPRSGQERRAPRRDEPQGNALVVPWAVRLPLLSLKRRNSRQTHLIMT